MKKLLFILFLIPSIMFAQTKYVKIPQHELDAVIAAIDTLEYQDSLKTLLIADLQLQNTNFFNLRVNDMAKFAAKDEEILLLNDQINLYQDRLKIADAWYNKRWFGIVIGVTSTSAVIYLAGQLD